MVELTELLMIEIPTLRSYPQGHTPPGAIWCLDYIRMAGILDGQRKIGTIEKNWVFRVAFPRTRWRWATLNCRAMLGTCSAYSTT
jgi:hypothetical protein